ncbi:MAG: DUF1499 domain-containing protein [Opitutaceae bacterium]|nr:DUF1499 domain-containing protein [Verrucomicrobiales bacterium]
MLGIRFIKPSALGITGGRLTPCPAKQNCVCSQDTDAAHQVDPLQFTGSTSDAKARLEKAIARLPRHKVITETDNYLHLEFTSQIMRFVDDVEFLIDEPNHVIHIRSAARIGYSDMGVNRNRVEAIRTALEVEGM